MKSMNSSKWTPQTPLFLQHWKPLKLAIVLKRNILLFSSLKDGRPGSGKNIVANTEFFPSIGSMS